MNSLYNSTDRSRMYSAGSDGHINVWTHGLKKLYSINIKMDMNI